MDTSGPSGRMGGEAAWDALQGEWGPRCSLLRFSYFSSQYFLTFLQDAHHALSIGSDSQVTQHLLPPPHPRFCLFCSVMPQLRLSWPLDPWDPHPTRPAPGLPPTLCCIIQNPFPPDLGHVLS